MRQGTVMSRVAAVPDSCAANRHASDHVRSALTVVHRDPACRRKPVHQRQPIQAFLETPRKIFLPALRTQSAPLSNLLHGHAEDQDIVHQRRTVGAEFMLGAIQAQRRLALPLGDRLASQAAIDIWKLGSEFRYHPFILRILS